MASGTWMEVFPAALNTKTESITFIKKLVAVGVSNIMYLRSNFPESAFSDHKLDGLKLKVLERDGGCPDASNLCECMANAFDAVEKGYLREMTLAVVRDREDPTSVLETYSFQFEYQDEDEEKTEGSNKENNKFKPRKVNLSFGVNNSGKGCIMETAIAEKDDIYRHTRALLHKINVATNNMDLLPDEAYLQVLLSYYDDRTPPDYEPPGFDHTQWDVDQEMDKKTNKEDALVTQTVRTKHHGLAVKIRSTNLNSEAAYAAVQSQAERNHTSEECKDKLICTCQVEDDEGEVGAGDAGRADGRLMLKCCHCESKQHAECFLVFSREQVPEKHACPDCAIELGCENLCADPKTVRKMKEDKNVKDSAWFRQILFLCFNRDAVTMNDVKKLFRCDETQADRVLCKLVQVEVVAEEDGDGDMKVDKRVLEDEVGPRFLGKNFERLVEEQRKMAVGPCDSTQENKTTGPSPMSKLAKQTQEMKVNEVNSDH